MPPLGAWGQLKSGPWQANRLPLEFVHFRRTQKRDGRLCPQEAFPTAVDRSVGDRVIRPFLLVAMSDCGTGEVAQRGALR